METIRSATTHYIEPGKFLLLENALGNSDLIQCSVSSDCRVTIVDQNNFPLDELEQWPVFRLTTSDIKLNNGDGPYNIYLVVPTSDNTVTGSASIGYSIYSIDRNGYRVTENGEKELVGSPRYKYYYTGSVSAQGGKPDAETTPAGKGRVIEMDLGVTPPATDIPGSLYDYDKIFEIDKVDPSNSNSWLLTILSVIKKMTVRVINVTSKLVFQKGNDSKELTDVAVDKDSGIDSKVENDIIASTAWVNKEFERNTLLYDAKYLFKDREDSTNFLLKLLGGVITDKIESQNFISGALGTGFLVKRDPKTGRSYAEFDEIYVRLKAIFESLTIKELQSVGGEILLTLASIECTKVEDSSAVPAYDSENARLYDADGKALFVPKVENGVYRCYFTADDGEKAIINQFAVGDLAQCRQFNIKEGVYTGVSNRYYWRYVVAIGDNYIDLSVDDCAEGSDIPQVGDKIIQLGHRTDPARQNAILLSAYGLTAPTIQMLQGIDSYSLDGKAVKEEGFDQETQQFYSKTYGRSYVGAQDESSYMKFIPGEGVKIKGDVELTEGSKIYWESILNSPEWINRWTTNGTTIGDDFMASPEGFFGRKDEDGKLTGILLGKDVTVDGKVRTGIFALVDNKPVFELDPITKQYHFIGKVEADSGRIGNLLIDGNILKNSNFSTGIEIESGDGRSLNMGGLYGSLISMRLDSSTDGRGNYGLSISSYGTNNVCLSILANTGSKFAIDSIGPHRFYQREGEVWDAPGVLAAANISSEGVIQQKWGEGAGFIYSYKQTTGRYRIDHGIGHLEYFVNITPMGDLKAHIENKGIGFVEIGIKKLTPYYASMDYEHPNYRFDYTNGAFEIAFFGRNTYSEYNK